MYGHLNVECPFIYVSPPPSAQGTHVRLPELVVLEEYPLELEYSC